MTETTTRSRLALFGTGFLQVIFVSANVFFISRYELVGNVLTAFCISLIWSVNVKRIAFGDWTDRVLYASGAALGSVCGTIIANAVFG